MKIAINGASGRIGRSLVYEISALAKNSLDLVMLNDPVGIDKIVESLSEPDPVHGTFDWTVKKIDERAIEINGKNIPVYTEKSPASIPFKEHKVDLLEECSGRYVEDKKTPNIRPADEFFNHGIKKVILSYPAKADATLIMGVNNRVYDPQKHNLISNASCTTKALAAPLAVLRNNGIIIENLLMDTVHASTNTQLPLLTLDQIATSKTGAARATGEVIPELKGRMDGLAYRVPTLDGSFANLYFVASFQGELTADKLNSLFKDNLTNPLYAGRYSICEKEEANSRIDIVGKTVNGIVLTKKTLVKPLEVQKNGRDLYHILLISGYDNERGPPRDQRLLTEYIASR